MNSKRLFALIALILSCAMFRLVPHPPNFTPTLAAALFAGVFFDDKRLGLGIVIASMLVSDAIIGFHSTLPVVYAALLLIGYFAPRGLRSEGAFAVAAVSLAASWFFFLVTNLGVWLIQDIYPKTLQGLLTCYTAALPFFGNSLVGDLFYTALLFGAMRLLERSPALREPATRSVG